jgi:hypothetical protein
MVLRNQLLILFSLSWYAVAYSRYSAQAPKFGVVVLQVLSNKMISNTKEKQSCSYCDYFLKNWCWTFFCRLVVGQLKGLDNLEDLCTWIESPQHEARVGETTAPTGDKFALAFINTCMLVGKLLATWIKTSKIYHWLMLFNHVRSCWKAREALKAFRSMLYCRSSSRKLRLVHPLLGGCRSLTI